MPRFLRWLAPVVLALVAFPAGAVGQPPPPTAAEKPEPVKATYTKYEYRVPMRDGVTLFTSVYVPKDDSQTYPILLMRTPYSCAPYGVDKYPDSLRPGTLYQKAGYIFVYQDVRGRWMSGGEFVNMRPYDPAKKTPQDVDETSDTFDTIDWLLKTVKGHNGKVGQWGISYPGFYTVCGMIDAHPALKAVSPQAPVTDWFVGDDWHHNGALFLPHAFNFMANFGKPRPEPITKSPFLPFDHGTPDGYRFFLDMGPLANADKKHFKGDVAFWNEVMQHGTYDDWWKARNVRQHVKRIKPAVLTVGGWFDAENLFGALETFKAAETNDPPKFNHLVMGPWDHGGWSRDAGDHLGDVPFNAKTGEFYREKIELPFFEFHLKGKGEPAHPKAWVFETGTNRWRRFDAWPPKDAKAVGYHFHGHGGLAPGEPVPAEPNGSAGADDFVSDPAKPVPFISKTTIGMVKEYMTADQRFAATRPDVLVYQTGALKEDATIAGPIEVDLFVSTTGTDADWVVKLVDVYPDDFPDPDPNPTQVRMGGYQQLVRGDVFRGKFRSSFEKPEPFEPGKVTRVKFTLPDTLHTFRPGHRIMVQVQSTWFPLVDRNPQTFCDIYSAAEKDFTKQTHRVYYSAEHPSRVTVRVVK
ncbi:MAG: X-Pro dipeptidyl-peptidase [Gemmataceae bacterium]|nr:X-Pro dipeptidyl-peptidase [Gemmataceae bacterium]